MVYAFRHALAVVVMAILARGAFASSVVITSPGSRSLQVLEATSNSGKQVGSQIALPAALGGVIVSTTVAGSTAFTIGVDGSGSESAIATLGVTSLAGSTPQLVDVVKFPNFAGTYFQGCYVGSSDSAAHNTGGNSYELYVYVECRSASGSRKAGNYVTSFTYGRDSGTKAGRGKLQGPSASKYYNLNTYDPKYKFVSTLNAISVLGAGSSTGSSGQGTAYIVLTTTSSKTGQVFKPALHVLANQKAEPLGILATAPAAANGYETPRFAIASPTSFFSLYRQLCPGGISCGQPGSRVSETVTLSRKYSASVTVGSTTAAWSPNPASLAISSDQTLYKLSAAASTSSGAHPPTLYARSANAPLTSGFKQILQLPGSLDTRSQISA